MRILARLQGGYFALTGLWAILHVPSFIAVTGPKTDIWLVKTVGVLVIAIGLPLMLARNISRELGMVATGSALGLAAIDIYYALSDQIRDIYLIDGVVELGFVAAWIWLITREPTS